jgi:hypothetical protein
MPKDICTLIFTATVSQQERNVNNLSIYQVMKDKENMAPVHNGILFSYNKG